MAVPSLLSLAWAKLPLECRDLATRLAKGQAWHHMCHQEYAQFRCYACRRCYARPSGFSRWLLQRHAAQMTRTTMFCGCRLSWLDGGMMCRSCRREYAEQKVRPACLPLGACVYCTLSSCEPGQDVCAACRIRASKKEGRASSVRGPTDRDLEALIRSRLFPLVLQIALLGH